MTRGAKYKIAPGIIRIMSTTQLAANRTHQARSSFLHTMGRRSRLFGGEDDTALWRAAEKHDDPRVRELLLKDPSSPQLNRHHPAKGTTPLMVACKKKRRSAADVSKCAQVVQHLLEFGADLNVVDQTDHKNTALHYAAYANATLAVEYLLHAGANACALNQKGHMPLDVARLRGRKQATAILTQHLAVKSGWLELNGNSLLPLWKRRWCVALACDTERTRFELCVFHAPSDLLPEQVLHIDSASRAEAVSGSSSTLYSWMEKPNMFTLDRPLVHQGVSGRRFSRDSVTGLTHGHGAVQVKKVLFAAESESTRNAWMAQLGNGLYPPPLGATQPYAHGIIDTQGRMSTFVQPRHQQPYEAHMGCLSVPTVMAPVAYGSEPGFSSFSPPPRQHIASPTTLIPAFAAPLPPPVARTPPPSAPSFQSDESAFYRGPGSYVSTRDASLSASMTSHGGSISINSVSLENFAPNVQLPPTSSAGSAHAQAHLSPPPPLAKRLSGGGECVVCMDATRDAICVPCGHIAGCYSCLTRIKYQSESTACCPICRSIVHSVVKIYDC